MMTIHNAVPAGRDAEALIDVDLSIFAAAPARFDEYEQQVRAEYVFVPEAVFRRERSLSSVASGALAGAASLAVSAARNRIGNMIGPASTFAVRPLPAPRLTIHLRSTQTDSPWAAQ